MGLFDGLFGSSSGAVTPSQNPLIDPQGIRQQAAVQGLQALFAGLMAAGQKRPVQQPGPGIGEAFAAFPTGYQQGMRTGMANQQLERQADLDRRWAGVESGATPVAGLTPERRQLLSLLGPEAGRTALAQSFTRQQGRMGTPEEHQMAGVPMGTLYFDGTNRPHILQTPQLAGMTTAAQEQERMRVIPENGRLIGPVGPAGTPTAPPMLPPGGPRPPATGSFSGNAERAYNGINPAVRGNFSTPDEIAQVDRDITELERTAGPATRPNVPGPPAGAPLRQPQASAPTAGGRRLGVIYENPRTAGDGFQGNERHLQAWNTVIDPRSDPGSARYAAAYTILSEIHYQPQPDPQNPSATIMVAVRPDLSRFRPPTYQYNQPVVQPAGTAAAPAAAPGTVPATTPAPAAPTPVPNSSRVNPAAVEHVRIATIESNRVLDALNNFERLSNSATGRTRFHAWLQNPTDPAVAVYQQAYNNMVVALRSPAFINTGVLQPAEMTMLANQLRDPQSWRGGLTTPEARSAQLGEIRRMVQSGINRQRESIGQQPAAEQPRTDARRENVPNASQIRMMSPTRARAIPESIRNQMDMDALEALRARLREALPND